MIDKISVVIPVYNSMKSIRDCYKSINNQTYQNLEIIIINDGSTDSTLEICQEIASYDNRVNIYSKKNAGVSSARNFGITHSSGQYLMFVDSDDILEPNACEKLITVAQKYNADVVCCNYYINYNKINWNDTKKIEIFESSSKAIQNYYNEFNIKTCIWNKIYKKNIVQLFDETLVTAEDSLFTLEVICSAKRIVCIPEYLYHYISGSESLTRSTLTHKKIDSTIKAHVDQITYLEENEYCKFKNYAINALMNAVLELYNTSIDCRDGYENYIKIRIKTLFKIYKTSLINKRLRLKFRLLIYCSRIYKIIHKKHLNIL